MRRKNPQAAKLTAVYESLTASIRLLAKTHPETLDYVAMPMADLENLVNEANGHQIDPIESLIRPTRTH